MSLVCPRWQKAFVHVPKTGGSSIEWNYKRIGWYGLKRPPYNKTHHVGFNYIKQHCPTLQKAYAIVRNPVDQAISYWRHWVHVEQIELKFKDWYWVHSTHHKRWNGVHVPQYHTISGTYEQTDISHTQIYDYKDIKNFYMDTIGLIPEDNPNIHNYRKTIEAPTLSKTDRFKILENHTDYKIWGKRYDWK